MKKLSADAAHEPFFSICIPVYNCGAIVLEALESVAKQSFDDWEVVVYDDGSTDDTPLICETQQILSPKRYRFIRGAHEGLLPTRMKLLKCANGVAIYPLDADDFIMDERALEKIYEAFERLDCDMVMFNGTRSLDDQLPYIDYQRIAETRQGLIEKDVFARYFCTHYDINNITFKAYKRSVATVLDNPPRLQMVEDRLQTLDLFRASSTVALIDELFCFYRPSDQSITRKRFSINNLIDQLYVEDLVEPYARSLGVDSGERDTLLYDIVYAGLHAIGETVPDRGERLELYRQIASLDGMGRARAIRRVSGLRADKVMAVRALLAGRLGVTDALVCMKHAARRIGGSGRR